MPGSRERRGGWGGGQSHTHPSHHSSSVEALSRLHSRLGETRAPRSRTPLRPSVACEQRCSKEAPEKQPCIACPERPPFFCNGACSQDGGGGGGGAAPDPSSPCATYVKEPAALPSPAFLLPSTSRVLASTRLTPPSTICSHGAEPRGYGCRVSIYPEQPARFLPFSRTKLLSLPPIDRATDLAFSAFPGCTPV